MNQTYITPENPLYEDVKKQLKAEIGDEIINAETEKLLYQKFGLRPPVFQPTETNFILKGDRNGNRKPFKNTKL